MRRRTQNIHLPAADFRGIVMDGGDLKMASVIVVIVIFVLLALAIGFICQNGGWQGGCGGNCASCHRHCSESPADKQKKK